MEKVGNNYDPEVGNNFDPGLGNNIDPKLRKPGNNFGPRHYDTLDTSFHSHYQKDNKLLSVHLPILYEGGVLQNQQ